MCIRTGPMVRRMGEASWPDQASRLSSVVHDDGRLRFCTQRGQHWRYKHTGPVPTGHFLSRSASSMTLQPSISGGWLHFQSHTNVWNCLPLSINYSALANTLRIPDVRIMMMMMMSAVTCALQSAAHCCCLYTVLYTGWAKKSKPDNFCNNFVYCQSIFIIFGTCTL